MRRAACGMVLAGALLTAMAAAADESSSAAGPQWNDRHMQSNFANRHDAARPPIEGLDASGHIAIDPTPPATRVPELRLTINPLLGWQPGAGSSASHAHRGTSSFTSSADASPSRASNVRSTTSFSTSSMRHSSVN